MTGTALDPTGKLQGHSWNAVKTGGKWHHVDVTWDDPVDADADGNTVQAPKSGNENHLYFLGSNQFFLEDHFPDSESEELIKGLFSDEEELPAPVDIGAKVEIPDFSLATSAGKILTKAGYGKGKKLLMVYGRTTCFNTSSFLNYIKPYIGKLKEKNVTVLLALYDNPDAAEMKKMETQYPGIVCTKVTENDQSMWEGLYAFQFSGSSVTFPVVFLKNAGNKMVFYSTGYVDNPLAVVAGAMAIPEDPAVEQTETTSESSKEDGNTADRQNTADRKNTADGKNTTEATVGNGVYRLSGSAAVLTGPKTRNITKLSIPATVKISGKVSKVKKISANALKGCSKLTTVTIGKNVTSIGAGAFSGCKNLTKVTIGAGVKTIGKNAFMNCVKLKTVTGGKNLNTISAAAFSGCKALTKLTLYPKVKTIGKNAFMNCKKLKTITIKTSKLTSKTVGANAFKGIYAKATIKIPKAKLKVYTTLLKKKGVGKKVKITK